MPSTYWQVLGDKPFLCILDTNALICLPVRSCTFIFPIPSPLRWNTLPSPYARWLAFLRLSTLSVLSSLSALLALLASLAICCLLLHFVPVPSFPACPHLASIAAIPPLGGASERLAANHA